MILQDAYIHVQQGLQNIAAFVGRDFKPWELDYLWYSGTNSFIRLVFPDSLDNKPDERYSEIQASLDDLRALTESNVQVTPLSETTESGYVVYKGALPSNYRHLINDRCIAYGIDCAETTAIPVPNRLTEQDELFNVLENYLHKTSPNSPVSKIDKSNITVYASYRGKQVLKVKELYIDYIRQPKKYDSATELNTVIEFPDDVVMKIVKTTIVVAAIYAEQNPNKIQFIQNTVN